jgi:hypothetical protein
MAGSRAAPAGAACIRSSHAIRAGFPARSPLSRKEGGLTLPGGGIKCFPFQGDPRQGAEKPLANRLDLIVVDGSAEIL